MTSYRQQKLTCAVCKTTRSYYVLASTNQFGSPDLDLRPPQMARRAYLQAIMQCTRCKYCAPSLTEAPETALATVHSHDYALLLRQVQLPQLARRWACWSLIQEEAGELGDAGSASVHAAWACDDARKPDGAEQYRNRAVGLLRGHRESGQDFAGDRATEDLILADLLRHNGRFREAESTLTGIEQSDEQDLAHKMAQFQLALIARSDRRTWRIEDAEEWAETPDTWHWMTEAERIRAARAARWRKLLFWRREGHASKE